MADEFCLKNARNIQGSFIHAVNLRYGTNGFTSLPKGGVMRIFRELGYQRPARYL